MRRKGHRGNLPGKSIPIRSHPTRSFQDEEIQSGASRGPVNVDQVMAANFKPELYIEKFPHGYDPFEGDVTALQKKVVWRPTKAQLDSANTRKKTRFVNISSGNNGRGMVQHEKPFAPKNARYIEVKTSPLGEGRVEHEIPVLDKNSDPIEMQSGPVYDAIEDVNHDYEKSQRAYRHTQHQFDQSANPQVETGNEVDPAFRHSIEQGHKHRSNLNYGYNAGIAGIQTSLDQDVPVRSTKASRNQVQAEIWTGDHYEYVAVNEFDHEQGGLNDRRRQPTEADYNQQAIPAYQDQYLEPIDETAIYLKDRRQQGDFERDQYAEYQYNDAQMDGYDETTPQLKNRRQKGDDTRDYYAGVGDHNEINTEDPHDRWNAAEYRRGRRVQYAQAQEPVQQQYDLEAPNDQHLNDVQTQQNRRHHSRPHRIDTDQSVDLRSLRANGNVEVYEQRRRSNARTGQYDEQEQYQNGEAGYEIPEVDDGITPSELQVEQRRFKQSTGRMETDVHFDHGEYGPGEKNSGESLKAKNRKNTPNHHVRSGFDAGVQSGTRVKESKSDKVRHQEGSTYHEQQMADREIDYESRTEVKPPSTRRQYSAKQANDSSIPELDATARTEVKPPSTRRQYSAKQASESSIPEVESEVRPTQTAAEKNRRQISARAENERAIPEFEDPDGTRLVEKQQKGRGVDEFEVPKHAGIQNPNDENAGFDPVSLETVQTKKHVAREESLDAVVDAQLHEAGGAKSGHDSNRRARIPIISPNIEARAQRNVIYRRKKKTEPINPVDEVAIIGKE